MERMTPIDAQMYWMSSRVPNDQFLLFAFDGEVGNLESAIDDVLGRAASNVDLTLRVADPGCAFDYPYWVRHGVGPDHVAVHQLPQPTWSGCLAAVQDLFADQLDLRDSVWRLHVFEGVGDVPRCQGSATVVVLQIGHALADGRRATGVARSLFVDVRGQRRSVAAKPESGYSTVRAATVAAIRTPKQLGSLGLRGLNAAVTHRRLVADVADGSVPAQADVRPALPTNNRPEGRRAIRTLVRDRDDFPGPTVTVGALAAISLGLSEHLAGQGVDTATLGAELTVAKPGKPLARNHFRNVGVELFSTTPSWERRNEQIAEALMHRRSRGAHPALRAADEAFAAVPAPLLYWGTTQFDPTAVAPMVIGNTVVSSINRGPADLTFGGAPVAFTAGYPALSPAMGVTHGVHGIGDTVAISVHAAESAIGNIDDYLESLSASIAWNRIVAGR
ncbi:wax ester/triacylglycerol synthase domain-containing protein [Williamsia muralis]|nr:wax ester/triacylglycerol synthase domain-containing protein [Williamsia muralis]